MSADVPAPHDMPPDFVLKTKVTPDRDGDLMMIGMAWHDERGDGAVIQLYAVPTDWTGVIYMVPYEPKQ